MQQIAVHNAATGDDRIESASKLRRHYGHTMDEEKNLIKTPDFMQHLSGGLLRVALFCSRDRAQVHLLKFITLKISLKSSKNKTFTFIGHVRTIERLSIMEKDFEDSRWL